MQPLAVQTSFVALVIVGAALPLSVSGELTPKEEAEAVLNAGIPFAQKMISEHSAFDPFGYAMKADGSIVAVPAHAQGEHLSSQQLIDNLAAAFRAGAAKGAYKVTAVFMVARAKPPGQPDETDVLQVGFDHVSGYGRLRNMQVTRKGV